MTHTTSTTDPRTIAATAAQAHKYNQKRGIIHYNNHEDFFAGNFAVGAGDPLTWTAETIFWHAVDAHSARREVALYRDIDAAQKAYDTAQKAYEATARAAAIARAELREAKNFLASVR